MMRVALYGGFGEKGRTCVGIESRSYRMLLDAGVKTGARGTRDYYPAISESSLGEQDAIVVTHGHEDHVAALGWCIARGFGGRIFMTPETRREADLCLQGYATPDELERFRRAVIEPLILGDVAWLLVIPAALLVKDPPAGAAEAPGPMSRDAAINGASEISDREFTVGQPASSGARGSDGQREAGLWTRSRSAPS